MAGQRVKLNQKYDVRKLKTLKGYLRTLQSVLGSTNLDNGEYYTY